MIHRPGTRISRVPWLAPQRLLVVTTVALSGCVANAPRMSMHAERYRIDVRLNPADHLLTGRAVMDLANDSHRGLTHEGPVAVELLLHPNLKITDIEAGGVRIKRWFSARKHLFQKQEENPRRYVVVLDRAVDGLTLFVQYKGTLVQDVSAGEASGRIHNFAMQAHIGEDGIYLRGGHWYPEPAREDDAVPTLADYTLVASPVSGMELAAGADRDERLSTQTGQIAWRSPYPLESIVLVGGAHQTFQAAHGDVNISVQLQPDQVKHANMLISAAGEIIDRYEPLIGPYPGRHFAIVDNFFSSGFAFPTFTLLSSVVIDMGERLKNAHGYLDHEMLHCWWGNGIQVDPRDGNWSEALASYGANYYGYVLDGREDEARRKRRNHCHFLARLKPDQDKPLGTYGLAKGCGRAIAYQKGAAVFHMLARKIGQDHFWSAMRTFTDQYVGRYASWEDIRRLCEEASGLSLETFFQQWVRRGGAPTISIDEARFHSADHTLTLVLRQGKPAFSLNVPIRIIYATGSLDLTVPLDAPTQTVTLPVKVIPLQVEADPDYQIFRRIPLDEIIPTTASTRSGPSLVTIVPAGLVPKRYRRLKSIFESSFDKQNRITLTAGHIEKGALAERCVLIVGSAVRAPYVAGFLSAIEFPVRWSDTGFTFAGVSYSDPGDAVLCTVRHPGVPGGGVTVLVANSEGAIPRAEIIPFYDRSLIVFHDGKAVLRHDFEKHVVVNVNQS